MKTKMLLLGVLTLIALCSCEKEKEVEELNLTNASWVAYTGIEHDWYGNASHGWRVITFTSNKAAKEYSVKTDIKDDSKLEQGDYSLLYDYTCTLSYPKMTLTNLDHPHYCTFDSYTSFTKDCSPMENQVFHKLNRIFSPKY